MLEIYSLYAAVVAAQTRLADLREALKRDRDRGRALPAKQRLERALRDWATEVIQLDYRPQAGDTEVTLWVGMTRSQADRARERLLLRYPDLTAGVEPWRVGRVDSYTAQVPTITWCVVVAVAHPMDALALDVLVDRR